MEAVFFQVCGCTQCMDAILIMRRSQHLIDSNDADSRCWVSKKVRILAWGFSVDCGSMLEPLFMEATAQASVFQYCSLDGQSRMGP